MKLAKRYVREFAADLLRMIPDQEESIKTILRWAEYGRMSGVEAMQSLVSLWQEHR